jgi:indole-3-glycerol phosphate synthase
MSAPYAEVRRRGIPVVGESGIHVTADVDVLQKAGVSCLLVGESLVKQDTPDVGIKKLFGRPV